MKTSPGKKRAHFDNGFVYGGPTLPTRLCRDLVSHRRRITVESEDTYVRDQHTSNIYRFVSVDNFAAFSLSV